MSAPSDGQHTPERFDVVSDLGVGFGAIAIAIDAPPVPESAAHHEAHARVAARVGGVQLAVSQHPPLVRSLGAPPWWVARLRPTNGLEHKQVRHALPRDVNVMKHARQAALAQGMVLAFVRQDLDLLHAAAGEAIVEPALGPLVSGYFPAKAAALAAGATIAAFCDRDGSLAAICPSRETAEAARDAALQAFAAHRVGVHCVVAAIAPESP